MLDFCLLGCGGGMPMPDRNLSSMLMTYNGRKILMDCGEGTQVSMRILGWGFKTIDVICITHCHGDHIVGLPGLLATIGNSGREEELTIIGPEGIKGVIEGLRCICPYLPYELKVIENPKKLYLKVGKKNTTVTEGHDEDIDSDIDMSIIELDHSAPCIGYGFSVKRKAKFDSEKALKNEVPKMLWSRLQKGEVVELEDKIFEPSMVLGEARKGLKLTYITDTRPSEDIVKFIKDSDTFICEGTYGDDEDIEKAIKNKHMTFREGATMAKEAKVKELIFTHFSPAMPEPEEYILNATSVFENTVLGYDRMVKSLSFEN